MPLDAPGKTQLDIELRVAIHIHTKQPLDPGRIDRSEMSQETDSATSRSPNNCCVNSCTGIDTGIHGPFSDDLSSRRDHTLTRRVRCWGIGLGRTGTNSLCEALRILGYTSVGHNPRFEELPSLEGGADNGVTLH